MVSIGWKILPSVKPNLGRAKNQADENEENESPDKIQAVGRLFPTEILGLEGNVVRYRDGSFAKAYRFEPANTLYDDERLTELRVEELKTLLKFEKPDKTIIQFRFVNKPDDGATLRKGRTDLGFFALADLVAKLRAESVAPSRAAT